MKYIIAVMLTLFMSYSYAVPPFDVPPGQDNQGSSNAEQQQQQQQQQSQAQKQANNSVNTNVTSSNSVSEGSSASSNVDAGSSANSSIDITTGGTNVINSTDMPKDAAHSAAGVFPQSCQEGASGQSYSGGASSVFESAMCQSLKMAEVHQKYWVMYTEMGDVNQADMHKKLMDKYVAKASSAAESMYYPKQVGTFFLSILPIGLIAFLL